MAGIKPGNITTTMGTVSPIKRLRGKNRLDADDVSNALPVQNAGAIEGGVSVNHPSVTADYNLEKILGPKELPKPVVAAVPEVKPAASIANSLDAVEGLTTKLGMGAMLVPGAIGIAGSGVEKLGKWMGSSAVTNAANVIRKPVEFINAPISSISQGKGAGGIFARFAQSVIDSVARMTAKVTKAFGLDERRALVNSVKARTYLGRAQQLAADVSVSGAHADVQSALGAVHKAVLNAETIGHVDVSELRQHLGAIKDSKIKLEKPTKRFVKMAGKALDKHQAAQNWQNVEGSLKTSMKEASLGTSLVNGSFILGSVISVFRDIANFIKIDYPNFKQIVADAKHTDIKNVSVFSVFGKLPKPLAELRTNLIGNMFTKQAVDALNIGVQVQQAVSHNFSLPKAAAAGGATFAVSSMADAMLNTEAISTYKTLHDAYANKQPLTVDDYAAFLGVASKELKVRGGAESPFTRAIAEKYVGKNPSDALDALNSGVLSAEIREMIAKNDAAKSHVGKLAQVRAAEPDAQVTRS